MCGPIAMMLPVNKSNPAEKVIQILIYHILVDTVMDAGGKSSNGKVPQILLIYYLD
jgi:hypothetical protein